MPWWEMPLPFVLSPYLRPVRVDGGLAFDNGIAARIEKVDPVAERLVRALWNPARAEAEVESLAAEVGVEAVTNAVEQLWNRAMLFDSPEACEAALDDAWEAGVPTVPFVDQVELTNACPMRCGFCPRGIPGRMKRATGFLDLALFDRLLGQMHARQAWYRPLELHHLGESLLHPSIDRFVSLASARGLPTELSLNPSLLAPELGARLLDAGVTRLVISLDGVDDDTLVSIRGPAARYGKAERNLDALLERVAGMARPPRVVIQMIALTRNAHQREAFLKRWGQSDLPTVTAYLKQLDGPDPDTRTESERPLVHLCSYPWRSVVVLWDGRVVPCCRDADGEMVLGDLNRQTLAEVWASDAVRELRRKYLTREPGAVCTSCAWHRTRYAAEMPRRAPELAVSDPLAW